MKKIIKIAGITLASFVGIVMIALAIVFWIVLTPSRLTPIVKEQAGRFISCEMSLEEVELTVFETFPSVGLKIKQLQLINPMPDAENDTVASVEYCTVGLNIKELVANKAIIVNQFHLKNGFANLFVDSLGKANYDVFVSDDTDTTESTFKLKKIDLQKVTIENLHAAYTNIPLKIHTETKNLNVNAKGKMQNDNIDGNVNLKAENTVFQLNDTVSMSASVNSFETEFEGKFDDFKDIDGLLQLSLNNIKFSMKDAKNQSVALSSSVNGLKTTFKGKINDLNDVSGLLQLSLQNVNFSMNNTPYAKSVELALNSPLNLLIDKQYFKTENTDISINEHQINLNGNLARNTENGDINMDMGFKTNTLIIKEILQLLPSAVTSQLPKMDIDGNLILSGRASGTYNNTHFPVVSADVQYNKGEFAMNEIPFNFNDIYTQLHIDLDLNSKSKLLIHNLNAKAGKHIIKASGTIDDLLNKLFCNLKINAQVDIPELKSVLPPEIKASGLARADMTAKFTLDEITQLNLDKIKLTGTLDLTDFEAVYKDSINIKSSQMHIRFSPSDLSKHKIQNEILQAKIQSKDLVINMIDFLSAKTNGVNLDVGLSNFMDTTKLPSVSCDFDFEKLNVQMDTISVDIHKPLGNIVLTPSKKNPKNPSIKYAYQNSSLSAQMGKDFTAQTQKINLSGHVSYNEKEEDLILQWNPDIKMDLQEGKLHLANFPTAIQIPVIKFDFSSRKFTIKESRIKLGNSDFSLSGIVTDINKYLKKTGLLKANLEFVSENTDVSQLMAYINGFGGGGDTTKSFNELEHKEDNPFMVPLGVDVVLNTTVKNALVGNTPLHNLHGQLTIKDGVLVLEEMGFTSEAARMQLTAIYRSPRKNHLFAGIDFHLLDIDIARLIEMMPMVDTLVPMLKSFAGKAEFHLAFETYMKSNYDLKYSTIRGATSIKGQDLVLMDNQTFSSIAKKLMFKKKTQNKIDSLSVELTAFKNEIDIYPFLISMDKYKAVVAGRHNLDMTFNYHISVTDTPLPIRLGVNVKGNLDKMKIRLVRCKYPKLYVPGKENATDKKIIELKKIISDALKANVKE